MSFKGRVDVSHTDEEVEYLLEVLRSTEIKTFVEIGVHLGGLAAILIDKMDHYLGVEIKESITDSNLKAYVSRKENCDFKFADAWSATTILEVALWLQNKRPAFIYCDGGKKPKELDLYAPLLLAGDMIGVHDFGIYDRAEIRPEQAEKIIDSRGFVDYEPSFRPESARIAIWRK